MKAETKSNDSSNPGSARPTGRRSPLIWAVVLLVISLTVMFWQSLDRGYVHFSNDGPLGAMVAEQNLMPSIMTGLWVDLSWLGSEGLSPSPTLTTFMRWVTTPFTYGRILPPASLFIVGVCACFCFRRFNLAPLACVLGGLAAGLNSDFLSTSCWGVASQIVGFGFNYLALGLLFGPSNRRQWLRVALAGFAVGFGVMEAYDIGAIFSLFVAAFILYKSVFMSEGGTPGKLAGGVTRIALVAAFAAFVSVHTLTALIGTQVMNVAGAQQDKQTKAQAWPFATQWSLPKAEAAQIIVPGIFGYRLDGPDGENYWGSIGADPARGNWRFTGTGYYSGVTVVLISLWAVLQSFRKKGSAFSTNQRRMIWFWTGVAVIAVPMAFGKFAPFYQLFYALPYASAIRDPTKFMHVFNWALVILFAHGIDGLYRIYMQNSLPRVRGMVSQFKNWLAKASGFERKWILGCFCAIGAGLLAGLIYASSSENLVKYMETVGLEHSLAVADAKFSLQAVGWFILFLTAGVGLLALICSGQFSGPRARTGGILLGFLLVLDLIHADVPWIHYWNVSYKYATNPIIDLLRDKPYEHRVEILPFGSQSQQMNWFRQVYSIEWHQQLFPYYNIQALGVVMEPRVTVDKDRFLTALPLADPVSKSLNTFNLIRNWELTNTKYLLGNGGDGFINALNQQLDPVQKRFRMLKLPDGRPAMFTIAPKPGAPPNIMGLVDLTAVADPKGELGAVEFTGALPRAKLFSDWQINTNDDATLKLLGSQSFDPHKLVLVADSSIPAPPPGNANQDPGTVEISPNYKSKRIELSADVKVPSVLLLTERYNPKWLVEVDGKPATLLRSDFILRGVYLTPGRHNIVMRFVTPVTTLYVSLVAIAIGLALCGWLAFTKDEDEQVIEPVPTASTAKAKAAV